MRRIVLGGLAALFVSTGLAADQQAHWGYEGKYGPEHWGEMDPGFGTCALGRMQSPIDIRGARKADLPEIAFAYGTGPAEVENNGHTIQVNVPASGGIDIGGDRYALLQFHFHTPSEETIAGQAFPMVAHVVHRNAAGNLAVIAVLFKEGEANPALEKVLDTLPAPGGKRVLDAGLDPTAILPAQRGYYAFTGSLTTPPCSEGVRWQVLKEPVELSPAQIAAFRRLYPMNARPVQPLNGRELLESRS